jgi:lipoyl(octanoyl) transferase
MTADALLAADILKPAAGAAPEPAPAPEWRRSAGPVDYPAAVAAMEARVAAIIDGRAPDAVWLLEHPPLYTGGTSAKPQDLLRRDLPVYETGRGGQYTYHGPGQRVAYVLRDLKPHGNDLRRYVAELEEWLILALGGFGIRGERRAGRVGIWVDMARHGGAGEAKIAALGVRVRRGVAFHGVSVNVDTDLNAFQGIVPCGIRAHGVTSLAALGAEGGRGGMAALDDALIDCFSKVFR